MLTLLLGKGAKSFRISHQEMIKGVRLGGVGKTLAYFNTLEVPIIENTAREEDLTESMAEAMATYPDAAAILVRRHGVYVWGEYGQLTVLQQLPRSGVCSHQAPLGSRPRPSPSASTTSSRLPSRCSRPACRSRATTRLFFICMDHFTSRPH